MFRLLSALVLLLPAHILRVTAQGNRTYDAENHFIFPPTPVGVHDYGSAINITRGPVTFEWVTNAENISLNIFQEHNSYGPKLYSHFSNDSFTWNGTTDDLGPNDGPWPNFDAYGNIFFLILYDANSTDGTPIICYSRYFRFVDSDATTDTTTSLNNATVSSSGASSSSSNSGAGSNTVAIGAGIGVGLGVPFLIAIGIIFWLLRRNKRNKASIEAKSQHQHQQQQPMAERVYPKPELHADPSSRVVELHQQDQARPYELPSTRTPQSSLPSGSTV